MKLLLLLQVSTALASEPYVDERLFVSFYPPAGWVRVEEDVGSHSILFQDPAQALASIQIDSFPYEIEKQRQLKNVQRELRRELRKQFPSLEIVDERSLTHGADTYPAIEITGTLPTGNTSFHVMQRCLFARGRIYVITAGTYELTFLQLIPTFRAAIQSVEVLAPVFDAEAHGRGPLLPVNQLLVVLSTVLVSVPIVRRISQAKLERSA